jgi:hypothetical protein
MPTNTPKIKVDAVQALGGTVELVGESYNETQTYAMERATADGRVFIAPYDDPFTIAGQGTIGSEIVSQVGGEMMIIAGSCVDFSPFHFFHFSLTHMHSRSSLLTSAWTLVLVDPNSH